MSTLEDRLDALEGQLDADGYLLRHLFSRLLATGTLESAHTISQLQKLADGGKQVAGAVDRPGYAQAFAERMQQIVDDFDLLIAHADGPKFDVITGGKADL